uniref:Ubiquitin-like modifier-activating enzyme ATG7 n=1 Tax=Phallusia mammillata TaxID=59560 RepID=A0A6F9D7A0_9ASCI|nr:ubiquitin-like modifier-activating enzyme ATG7 [Phallusia mammillata]
MAGPVQFLPFASAIESGFWNKLAENKLNVYKLDDAPKRLNGFYTNTDVEGLPCRHNVDYKAFEKMEKAPPLCFMSHGTLWNKNTIEDFKSCNKKQILQDVADTLWQQITNGEAIKNPSCLVRFVLLSFADLKKYLFYYWFAFPAFVHPTAIVKNICKPLSNLNCPNFQNSLQQAFSSYGSNKPGFFLLSCSSNPFQSDEVSVNICALTEFERLLKEKEFIIFGLADPSTLEDYPAWPLRNFLTLISYHWSSHFVDNLVRVICFRDRTHSGKRTIAHSLYLEVNLPPVKICAEATGWEKNKKNKLAPRSVSLAESMDPTRLAMSSVNLNLKLMRWRLMPSLDLEAISSCKCLLLGSGTLGCNVARGLLGWGVTDITMVDNGTVSFSNPVRQSLFEFSDCSPSGGKPKALAAAEKLKLIYPGVNAVGVELSIPMPGHPVHSSDELVAKVQNEVHQLEELIDSHDVVFLLMDTRESRWLPTMMCAAKDKLVINSALGFDSYLVMRHGIITPEQQAAKKLGCYFCNDVVAPGNSLRDRSLDQQCTVSRPGVSMIASALAVELLASVLQHPSGKLCMPDNAQGEFDPAESSLLGPVPHQIRGFLSNNQVLYPSTEAFSKCTACSDIVLDQYKSQKFDFLLDVFNSPNSYLEDLTGLTLLHQQTAQAEADILEFSDTESI